MLLEQAPVPTVTVQKTTEGGGAEIERIYPRQTPLLQFELKQGFIVTGQIRAKRPSLKPELVQFHPILQRFQITGQIAHPILEKHLAIGKIIGTNTLTVHVRGAISRHLQLHFKTTGEITENTTDLERDINDLRYILDRKRRRHEQ